MFCKKCGTQINEKALKCLNCNEETELAKMNNNKDAIDRWMTFGCLVPIVFIVLAIIILSTLVETSQNSKQNLEVLKTYNCKLSSYGGSAVCGVIINNSDKNMSYAQVNINIYDLNGTQIGSTLANINNLAPKAKWEFKAPIIQEGKYKWQIVDVTGF